MVCIPVPQPMSMMRDVSSKLSFMNDNAFNVVCSFPGPCLGIKEKYSQISLKLKSSIVFSFIIVG